MTKIAPFKALVYNQKKSKDLSMVACPPYDVISIKRQDYFHKLSPHNFIHILLPKASPHDDKYERAGKIFKKWQDEGIFVRDDSPAVYVYNQRFLVEGKIKSRLGFIALLKLPDKVQSVFGHEHTRLAPKEDRLKLIQSVKANLSPIFVIFSDQKNIMRRLNLYIRSRKACMHVRDDAQIVHDIWRLKDSSLLDFLTSQLSNEKMFIADGHHRFEVSCMYREIIRKMPGALRRNKSCNYLLAYFTDIQSKGLAILPIHRIIKLKDKPDAKKLKVKLSEYFELEKVKSKTQLFLKMKQLAIKNHVLGMYKDKKFWLLRLKDNKILDKVIADKPAEYRRLDVLMLNYLVLRDTLGLGVEDKEHLEYNNSPEEVIKEVNQHPNYISFFLNPVKVEQVMEIALSGNKMPPKSTFFYPKVLSGLVINKLE